MTGTPRTMFIAVVLQLLLLVLPYSTYALSYQHRNNYNPFRHYPLQRNDQTLAQPVVPQQGPTQTDIQKYNDYLRQIQQWQIAVVVPQGSGQPGSLPPGSAPPGALPPGQAPPPPPPGNVWIQVPAGSYYPPSPAPEPVKNEISPPPAVVAPSPPEQPIPPGIPDNNFPPEAPHPIQWPVEQPYPIEQPLPPALPPPSNELPGLPPPSNELPTPDSGSTSSESSLKGLCKAPRGQFPGTSCEKFVNCWDDVVIEQDCPSGLYFNPTTSWCDYPYNVQCGEQGSTGPAPVPPTDTGVIGGGAQIPVQPAPVAPVPPPTGGTGGSYPYPPPGPVEGSYPPPPPTGGTGGSYPPPDPVGGTYPPPPSQPIVVPPPPEYVPPPPSSGPTEIAPIPSGICQSSYGTYRSKTNCGQFYVCVAGKPYEFICPAGLNFHEDLKVCDYPYRVECNGVPTNPPPPPDSGEVSEDGSTAQAPEQPVLPPSPPPSVPAPVSEVPPSYYGLRKHPSYNFGTSRFQCLGRNNAVYRLTPTCNSVAVCRNGQAQVINCGHGTSFDTRYMKCLSVYYARC